MEDARRKKRFEGKLQMRGKMRNKLSLGAGRNELQIAVMFSEESKITQLIVFTRLKEDVTIKGGGSVSNEAFYSLSKHLIQKKLQFSHHLG